MKIKQLCLGLMGFCAIFHLTAAIADMDARSEREIRVLCEQLFADYAVYIDHLNAEGFASIFTPDGVFGHGTDAISGPENLKAYIRQHGDQAHLIMFTTVEIDIQSETQASGIGYAVILSGDRKVLEGDAPVQMNGITAASEYHANFALTDEGWKISRMEILGKFRGPGYVQQ